MQIIPQEIDSVEDAGMLDGSPVKLIRLKGGFWLASGKPKGKFTEEVLAAGSHPAIVKYNIEREHPTFQPIMMKSETFAENTIVEKHSHFLSDELRKSGYDIYSVQIGSDVDFHITKHNFKISKVDGNLEKEFLIIKNLNIPKEFSRAMAGASVEKAISCEVGLKFKSK